MKHTHLNRTKRHAGFTLIELLVVVAIIAVIGAGVAVTYRNLDEKAKTAMEMNDIGVISSAIKNWSVVNDYKLPNKLDSLIGTDGNLYSQMTETMGGSAPGSSNGWGLLGPIGYTAMVETAPAEVISALSNAGLTQVFLHRNQIGDNVANANDATYDSTSMTIPGYGEFTSADVDTSETLCTLSADAEQDSADAALIVAANDDATAWFAAVAGGTQSGPFTMANAGELQGTTFGNGTYTDLTAWQTAYDNAVAMQESNPVDKLAFIYPEGGASMMGMTMPMNLTYEIISNIGLTPDDVALPTQSNAENINQGRKFYLVVMGLGRFASIYNGKAIRIDVPAFGKRQGQDDSEYNRYLVLIRVPVTGYDSMTGDGESASVAAVLTPQGYSAAALRDNYASDEKKLKD